MKSRLLFIWNWIKINPLFCVVALLLSLMYLALSLWRHWHFQSAGFDLGIFDQAIWHYSRFEAPMGTIRVTSHLLADHFHPILVALAPLYWIVPKPETLLVVQNLLWTAGLVPIYLFSRHRGHSPLVSTLLVLSYGLFWGITLALNFDFHEVAFAFLLIPLSIYLIELKKWKWLWVSFAILLLVKEEMGFVVAFFGFYLIARGYWKQGIATFAAGVSWFLLATKVFIPYFAGRPNAFGYWTYSQIGDNPIEAIKTLITQPVKAATLLFTPEVKANTLRAIFWPWLFMPLISPILIIGLPLILQRFWSDQSLYWLADFHYTGTLSAILVMAAADTLARLRNWWPNKNFAKEAVVAVCFLILACQIFYIPSRPLRHLAEPTWWYLSDSDKIGYKVLQTIPKDATVSAQNSILPHISQRDYAYLIHNQQAFFYSEYVALSASANLYPFFTIEEGRKFVEEKIAGKGYKLIVDEGGWLIWHSPAQNQRPPIEEKL